MRFLSWLIPGGGGPQGALARWLRLAALFVVLLVGLWLLSWVFAGIKWLIALALLAGALWLLWRLRPGRGARAAAANRPADTQRSGSSQV